MIANNILSTSTEKVLQDKSMTGNVCIGIHQVIEEDTDYLNP